MNDKFKTPGLNNPETNVLTHNRYNTYMVLIFTDLKRLKLIECHIETVLIKKLKWLQNFIINIYLDLLDLKKEYMLEKKLTKTSYSKLKIKNIFMWEKKYLLLNN